MVKPTKTVERLRARLGDYVRGLRLDLPVQAQAEWLCFGVSVSASPRTPRRIQPYAYTRGISISNPFAESVASSKTYRNYSYELVATRSHAQTDLKTTRAGVRRGGVTANVLQVKKKV